MLQILADTDITTKEWGTGLKSVVFVGVFGLAAIIAFIWWLRRS